ncbi:unnamed protein product [Owenia fusiformis]|uniref:SOCS box domain-containing protein n=1 Tax=Owenia fusiformis TaxID=6347 RepID=A0A8S4NT29_OWEFU|nr:unnamed protein product [Owenia fusiformis]
MAFQKFRGSQALQKQIQSGKRLVEQAGVGNIKDVKELLDGGLSVNAREYTKDLFYSSLNFKSPLQSAVKNGHIDVVNILIENGADLDFEDRYGITALHIAAEEGHFQCMKLLLDNEADPNKGTKTPKWCPNGESEYVGDTTPLHLAVQNNRIHCIKELIVNGADYNKVNELGETSLNIAATLGLEECVTIQLRNAISKDILSLPTKKTGNTPLHCCVLHGMYDAVDLLLQHGSDVNILNNAGVSPLHLACTLQCSNLEILELMLKKGFDVKVDVPDIRGNTPLKYATIGSHLVEKTNRDRQPKLAALLIAYGADYRKVQDRRYSNLLEHELRCETMDDMILQAIVQSEVNIPALETIVNTNTPLTQYHNQSQPAQPGGTQMNSNPMVRLNQPNMPPNQQRDHNSLMQMLSYGSVHRAVRLLHSAGYPGPAADLRAYMAGLNFIPHPSSDSAAAQVILRQNGLPELAQILQFHDDFQSHGINSAQRVPNLPLATHGQPPVPAIAPPIYRPVLDSDSEDEGLVDLCDFGQAIGGQGNQNGQAMGGQNGQAIGIQNGQAMGGQNGQAIGIQNGQAMGGQNGQAIGIQNGQGMGGQNGQALGIQNGRAMGGQNGQGMGVQNGQAMGGQNGQAIGIQNGQAMGGQNRQALLRIQNGRAMGGQNGQGMGGQNGQAIGGQNGQAIGDQHGQAIGGQNEQPMGGQNGQAMGGQGNQNRQAMGGQGDHVYMDQDDIFIDALLSVSHGINPGVHKLPEATYLREKHEWYKNVTQSPFSLHHYCRYTIRKSMGASRLRRVSDLNLPPTLSGYILLQGEDLRL